MQFYPLMQLTGLMRYQLSIIDVANTGFSFNSSSFANKTSLTSGFSQVGTVPFGVNSTTFWQVFANLLSPSFTGDLSQTMNLRVTCDGGSVPFFNPIASVFYEFDDFTLTLDEEYTTNSGWIQTGTKVTVDSGVADKVDFDAVIENSNHMVEKTISGVNYEFYAETEITFETHSGTTGGGLYPFVIKKTSTGNVASTSNDAIGINVLTSTGAWKMKPFFTDAGSFTFGTNYGISSGNTYYITLSFDGTIITMKTYSDSGKTTLLNEQTIDTSGVLSGGWTILSHETKNSGTANASWTGQIDNTEVIDNYKLENQATVTNYSPTVTLDDNFDTSNASWTEVGSNITVDDDGSFLNILKANAITLEGDHRIHRSIGETINNADDFTVSFDFQVDSISASAFLTLVALTADTSDLETATNQDYVSMWIDMGSYTLYLRDKDDTTTGTQTTGYNLNTSTKYYVDLISTGNVLMYTLYSDSAKTQIVTTQATTMQSGTSGLTTVQSGSIDHGNAGTGTYDIDNLKIYKGFAVLGASADGTITGATTGISGIRNEAYTFSSDGDEISLGTTIGALLETDYTMSAWLKHDPTSTGGASYAIAIQGSGSNEINIKYVDTTNVLTCYTEQGAAADTATYDFDTGTIHSATIEEAFIHVACVFDESETDLLMYINGQFAASDTSTSVSYDGNGNEMFVGAYSTGVASWDGEIDDVAIFTTVLSDSEIAQLYNDGASLDIIP